MIATRHDFQLLYTTLRERVETIRKKIHAEKKKSPTITEIAAVVGKSEEMILESLEYGRAPMSHHFH